jgi:chemotaxis signal transduction protein
LQCIAFRVGGHTFSVGAEAVVSALEAGQVRPTAAGDPAGACGRLSSGAGSISVFNVAEWLGVTDDPSDGREHTVIAKTNRGQIGLQVRGVTRLLTIPAELSRQSIPREGSAPFPGVSSWTYLEGLSKP